MKLLSLPLAVALSIGLLASTAASAQDSATVGVENAWARSTVTGQRAGGGFLTLQGRDNTDRLLGASAPVADRVELHSMTMDGDVMRMREVDAIDVPAGQKVELKPGGYHLMLMGLKRPLQAGTHFPLKLRFERGGEVTIEMKVEAAGSMPAHGSDQHR